MNNQNEIKKSLEAIFDKYKFTAEQRAEAAMDLIKVGEALTFDALMKDMPEDKQPSFKALFSNDTKDEDMKNVYAFLSENVGEEKVNETRGIVYDKLVADYIKHMNS